MIDVAIILLAAFNVFLVLDFAALVYADIRYNARLGFREGFIPGSGFGLLRKCRKGGRA